MFTKVFAGLGVMLKLFKVVATSSRPLEVQGTERKKVVPGNSSSDPL
mgnify:CR=1 FL=1